MIASNPNAEPLRLSAAGIAGAVGGQLVTGRPDLRIDGFSIDTRTLETGDLFFAIPGPRFDGHGFVEQALRLGASGAVISEPSSVATPEHEAMAAVVIQVADTVAALQTLAADVRRRSGTTLVAVTGSVGKTTTKEVTATLLAGRYRVVRNPGNLNNHIGLPLSMLALRHRPDVAVMELGMNRAGEISRLVAIAQPDLRVWTNVAEVHAEFFPSLDAIADAKAEVLEGATRGTRLVVNAGDPRVMARVARCAGDVMTFGIETAADVEARDVQDHGLDGMAAQLRTPGGEAWLRVPLLGRGGLANVLAGIAVALGLEVPLDEVVSRAETLKPLPGRGRVLRLSRGVTVIDESYNSSPVALQNVLQIVRHHAWRGRRVAILGEMLELGPRSLELHEVCGRSVNQSGIERLLTIGDVPARALGIAARAAGMSGEAVTHVSNSEHAARLVAEVVQDRKSVV